jgi:SAM-dependent methyltransferase
MTARFAYDEVPYDTEANSAAHPRSMGTLARLHGIEAVLASGARVLEIGCGDGEHMILAASYLPGARFVGFDLSSEAIARGVAAAAASGVTNVELLHRDLREVAKTPIGTFDYVVAHGVYSWVPAALRPDVLKVMRDALSPNGVAFLSVNALPGWELRRTLRALMREAAASFADPKAKVEAALAAVDGLAELGDPGGESFANVLAIAAAEYREHVTRATPPDAPFSRYVFHDLLAECNDPFSIDDLAAHAKAAGLQVLCDTPSGRTVDDVRAAMRAEGSPFLQVLLTRSEAAGGARSHSTQGAAAIGGMHLWADLTAAGAGLYKTTGGAVLRAAEGSSIARAAKHAPGFVAIRELAATDDEREALAKDLLVAARDGSLVVAPEPIALVAGRLLPSGALPRVSPHVRARAAEAVTRRAVTGVLTSALHESFRVPWIELVVIRELDGKSDQAAVVARVLAEVRDAPSALVPAAMSKAPDPKRAIEEHVTAVLERFGRHGFFVGGEA